MKFYTLFSLILVPQLLFGLSIQKDTFGDITVFFTQYPSQADLLVYITDIPSVAVRKEEIWRWVEVNPDLKIRLTHIRSAADLVVSFTSFRSQAGWRKQHPLKNKLLRK